MTALTLRFGSKVVYRGESLRDAAVLVMPLLRRETLRPPTSDAIRFFSVCSGIEAASVAWKPLGWQCVGVAEIEKFPSAVLKHHYPDVPNHGDFTKIRTSTLGRIDILCGGTPCQAFSIAGARRSLDDARGNLTLAFVGLAHELADGNGLRNVVWENVTGVLSTKDNAFGCFLAGLVGADDPFVPVEPAPDPGRSNRRWGWSAKERSHYIKWPRTGLVTGSKGRAAWAVKDAQYFGLAQRRERVIVVADFGNGADPAAVLFEPEGVRRDSPPRREAGQGFTAAVAPSLVSSDRGVARTGDTRGQDPVVAIDLRNATMDSVTMAIQAGGMGTDRGICPNAIPHTFAYAPEIARCVATREGSSQDFESTTMVAVSVTGQISHALKAEAEGADASEDGTGRGTPIICFQSKTSSSQSMNPSTVSPPLDVGKSDGVAVLTVALRGREAGALRENPNSGPDGVGVQADIAYTLEARTEVQAIQMTSAVRRLTPRECERLQGFQFLVHSTYPGAWIDASGRWWSPDYTAIPWRGKPATECPNGPRYKSLGNSWAVPKFRWLGERIQRFMPR